MQAARGLVRSDRRKTGRAVQVLADQRPGAALRRGGLALDGLLQLAQLLQLRCGGFLGHGVC